MGDDGASHIREVICHDKSIICKGLSSKQAKQQLNEWLGLWRHAQKRPVVLPAALVRKENAKWVENEQGQVVLDNMPKLQEEWLKNHSFGGIELESNEASCHHRDWKFILQQQAPDALFELSCTHYAEKLYRVMDADETGAKKLEVVK